MDWDSLTVPEKMGKLFLVQFTAIIGFFVYNILQSFSRLLSANMWGIVITVFLLAPFSFFNAYFAWKYAAWFDPNSNRWVERKAGSKGNAFMFFVIGLLMLWAGIALWIGHPSVWVSTNLPTAP